MEYERLVIIANQQTKATESMTFKKIRNSSIWHSWERQFRKFVSIFLSSGQPHIFNGIIVAIILSFLNQYCGWFTLMIYSVVIFQDSGTHIDPHISTIILGAVQVAGNLSSTSLVETLGRKLLLIISMAGCTIGLSAMASYMYLVSLDYDLAAVQWIPVASLCFVIFSSSVGITPLLILCIVERLPSEVKIHRLSYSVPIQFKYIYFTGT